MMIRNNEYDNEWLRMGCVIRMIQPFVNSFVSSYEEFLNATFYVLKIYAR